MKIICSSEKPVDFQQTTWCYFPEYGTFIMTAVRTSNLTRDAFVLGDMA
jgi:hypothetical protein